MIIESGIADVNGTRLYYEVAGDGLSLVLIHGFTLDTRMWDDQFEEFAQQYRVVRYDVRGFGKSALPTEESYSHVDDLKALLNHLEIVQAHILGLSMGGSIAINFALSQPEMTRKLIVVDAGPEGSMSDKGLRSLDPILARAGAAGGKAANEVWLDHPLFKPARENPAVGARLAQIVGENSGWHWVNSNPLRPMDPPVIPRLNEIKAPVLIIMGEHDESYIHESAAIMRHGLREPQLVVLPNVGHMSNMEAPQLFNEVVLSFLAG